LIGVKIWSSMVATGGCESEDENAN